MTAFRGPGVRQIGAAGTTPKEHRLALAGQYAENGPGIPRSGLLMQAAANVVTPTAATGTLTYSVAPLAAVISRTVAEGVYTPTTTGATTVNTGAAPASGSRYDLIWIRQSDPEKGDLWPVSGGVTDNEARIGVTQGTASATPARPTGTVPAGALVIAEARIFSGTASTTASPNTMTRVFPITAARGAPIPVRNAKERDDITNPAPALTVARLDLSGVPLETYDGTKWLISDIPWTILGMAGGFTHLTSSGWSGLKYRVKNGVVTVTGAVTRESTWSPGTTFAVIPAELKPSIKTAGVNCEIEPTVGNIVMNSTGINTRSVFVSWPLD